MIKPFTCLTLLFAAGSGLYLYSAKHKVELLDREIARLERTAQDSRARAGLLHAQYDLLGDPDRLRELAGQVLTLQPTAPGQFTTLAELDRRLPPPGPLPTPVAPSVAEPTPVLEKPVIERPAVERQVERPAEKLAERPAAPAPAKPAPRPPAAIVSVPQPRPAAQPVAVAQPGPAAPPGPLPHPAPAPRPPMVSADSAARALRGPAVEASVPAVASALGMARAMRIPQLTTTAQAPRQ